MAKQNTKETNLSVEKDTTQTTPTSKQEDIKEYSYDELFSQISSFLKPLGNITWVESEDEKNPSDRSINIIRNITENGVNISKQLFKIRVSETDFLVIKK